MGSMYAENFTYDGPVILLVISMEGLKAAILPFPHMHISPFLSSLFFPFSFHLCDIVLYYIVKVMIDIVLVSLLLLSWFYAKQYMVSRWTLSVIYGFEL